jgi:hypothetical protein
METESTTSEPLGIVLIATFWIVIGALILSQTSQFLSGSSFDSIFGLILFFIGIGLIVVGWGLLTRRRWAFFTALILSLLGLIPLLFFVISLVSMISYGYRYGLDFITSISTLFELVIFILFIVMSWYLFKKIKLFEKRQ